MVSDVEREDRNDDRRAAVAAVRLMRLALPLLDRSGHAFAALHLQRAVDGVDMNAAATVAPLEIAPD